mmetsp:Transcript_41592/g.115746  ORF Transcript_41592/g.115746 Transcript_41592/m.115746 type:complete len:200 (-) Transcript_41592:1031-1630(-)
MQVGVQCAKIARFESGMHAATRHPVDARYNRTGLLMRSLCRGSMPFHKVKAKQIEHAKTSKGLTVRIHSARNDPSATAAALCILLQSLCAHKLAGSHAINVCTHRFANSCSLAAQAAAGGLVTDAHVRIVVAPPVLHVRVHGSTWGAAWGVEGPVCHHQHVRLDGGLSTRVLLPELPLPDHTGPVEGNLVAHRRVLCRG